MTKRKEDRVGATKPSMDEHEEDLRGDAKYIDDLTPEGMGPDDKDWDE